MLDKINNKIKGFFQPHSHRDNIGNPDENELSETMINNVALLPASV